MISETIYPKPEPTDIADCLQFVVPEHLCVGGAAEPFLYGGSGFAACVAAMEYFTGLPAIFASAQFTGKGRNGDVISISPEYISGGNSIKQCRLSAQIGDAPFATLLGATGARDDDTVHQGVKAPNVLQPHQCEERSVARQISSNLNALFEFRLASGQLPDQRDWTGAIGQDTAFWIRKRSGIPLSRMELPVIADLAAMALPSALGKPASGNSLDNNIRFVREADSEWILSCTQVASVQHGLTHIGTNIFSQDGSILAVASQSMILRVRPPN
jgi:acyl-CoA thioesterase